ncbi:hypothetical protein LY76DRAFT_506685, partial [Colletotrichum caudatum]
KTKRTYNTRYSLVVTDPTTNPALIGLSMGERTGSRVLQWVWSYVEDLRTKVNYRLDMLDRRERALTIPTAEHHPFSKSLKSSHTCQLLTRSHVHGLLDRPPQTEAEAKV